MSLDRWCPKTHNRIPQTHTDQSVNQLCPSMSAKKNTRMEGITTHHGTYAVANLSGPVAARITNIISFLVPNICLNIYIYIYIYIF